MDASDEQLVARALGPDGRQAFGALVERHQSALRATLRRFTHGNAALADDLAQETFIRAYRALAAFRGDSGFRTWLYRTGTAASSARRAATSRSPKRWPSTTR